MWSRRPDGTLATDVPRYRQLMPYLMRTRNESVVYFEQHIALDRTEAFIARYGETHPEAPVRLLHVVLWAMVRTLHRRPRLNRFVAGGRIWQRDGIWISFSAKKRLDDDSPIVVIKRRFDPEESFDAMVEALHSDVRIGKSEKKSTTDKELALLTRLPGPVLGLAVRLARRADSWGLLPRSFICSDPMFASIFVANLGSLKMDAAYHHLFEYGNIPIFCVIGRTQETPVVRGGQVVSQRSVVLRFSYDERIEDGLYAQASLDQFRALVEDPEAAMRRP